MIPHGGGSILDGSAPTRSASGATGGVHGACPSLSAEFSVGLEGGATGASVSGRVAADIKRSGAGPLPPASLPWLGWFRMGASRGERLTTGVEWFVGSVHTSARVSIRRWAFAPPDDPGAASAVASKAAHTARAAVRSCPPLCARWFMAHPRANLFRCVPLLPALILAGSCDNLKRFFRQSPTSLRQLATTCDTCDTLATRLRHLSVALIVRGSPGDTGGYSSCPRQRGSGAQATL